ncbi:MAG TPA: hypothetical protein VJT72_19740 [Pseudonocardiaceae bacterium]|nr:hypothetical protein [Pseudonocardiaceae bacterium]
MRDVAGKTHRMLHEELQALAEPVLRKFKDHPFWSGLRDSSLPVESLKHFVEQDTGYLLPAYARALARCAAMAVDDSHAMLLGQSIFETLAARDRLRAKYGELAEQLGTPPLGATLAAVAPGTHAYAAFFQSASARSLAAGIGAVLPMVWFNFSISNDLKDNYHPGSRYAPWIDVYRPGEDYQYTVRGFTSMVDELGGQFSPSQRQELVEYFTVSTRYEWMFVENSWTRAQWPV